MATDTTYTMTGIKVKDLENPFTFSLPIKDFKNTSDVGSNDPTIEYHCVYFKDNDW